MDFLYELGLFAAQTALIVLAIIAVVLTAVMSSTHRGRGSDEGYIEVRSINDRFDSYANAIRELSDTEHMAKARAKLDKKAEKAKTKSDKARIKAASKQATEPSALESDRPRTFVLNFDGDMMASQLDALREEISAVLPNVQEGDEVVLRLESPGGVVSRAVHTSTYCQYHT